ncbi:MAG TPA: Rieske (2Fe-2S) protein, partial [Caulobacteraceae bacterium]
MTATSDPSIERLILDRVEGCALSQSFYVREDVYTHDLDLLLAGWTFIGHESEIPDAGDWITGGFGRESAIVVRGEDGQIRALANVCRHRGSRVCVESNGHSVALTCPYHAWSYRLDGSLRAAREMP